MQIFIKTITIECTPNSTVGQIKQLIYQYERLPVEVQILMYQSNQLDNSRHLFECGVRHESKLYMYWRYGEGGGSTNMN